MIRQTLFIVLLLAMPAALAAAPRTMRVDYYHTGNASEERFSLDRVVLEPLPWPGNPARADRRHQPRQVLLRGDRTARRTGSSTRAGSRPIYGEWETTGEAKKLAPDLPRVAALSRRPRRRSQVVAQEARRAERLPRGLVGRSSIRRTCSSTPSKPASPGPLLEIQKHGEPADKVDFLILGDGYTAAERGKFEKDARRLAEILFAVVAVQGAARRLQRLGPLPAVGGVGHLAPVDRRPPPLPRRRDLRRVRLRALRPDLREPARCATSPPSRPTSSSRS